MGTRSVQGWVLAGALLGALPGAAGEVTSAQERQIELSRGESLRVVERGRGEPIVLVPGLLGSAFGFRKLMEPLAESGRRVIVIEPLGVGSSGKPADADYSLTAQADRLDAALAALGVRQAVVVAHAVGASMALRLAYRHPERVTAIVSLDGGPAEAAATPGFRRAMRFSFLLKLFGGVSRIRKTVRSALMERSADPGWVTEDVVDGYMGAASRDLDGTLGAFRGMAKSKEPQPLAARLPEVRCPVLLVIGTATRAGGISEAEMTLLAERLPNFSAETVASAGHFVFEEQPQAVVTAVGRAFVLARAQGRIAATHGAAIPEPGR